MDGNNGSMDLCITTYQWNQVSPTLQEGPSLFAIRLYLEPGEEMAGGTLNAVKPKGFSLKLEGGVIRYELG